MVLVTYGPALPSPPLSLLSSSVCLSAINGFTYWIVYVYGSWPLSLWNPTAPPPAEQSWH